MAAGYDHDHQTDRVRAALCDSHNTGLGFVGDAPASLRAVADWLETADLGFDYIDWKRAQDRRYGASHVEENRARCSTWYYAHIEERRAYDAEHKEHKRAYDAARRAKPIC
jgi:cytochrome P450